MMPESKTDLFISITGIILPYICNSSLYNCCTSSFKFADVVFGCSLALKNVFGTINNALA